MHLPRFYTRPDRNLYEGVRFRTVRNEEWIEYTVPQHWAQAAADLLCDKIFYPEALPALTKLVEETDVPAWLWRSEVDDTALENISAEWRYRTEKDIRDVLHRVAGALTYQAWKSRLIRVEEDAKIFYDELRYILLHQIAAPELEQWRWLGLDWAYGLSDTRRYKPQHRTATFRAEEKNTLRRIQLLGETLTLETEETKTGITLPIENIDSAAFIAWKRNNDLRQIKETLGHKILETAVYHVMDACDRSSFFGFDPARNAKLRQAMEEARRSGLGEAAIRMAISYAEQGFEEIPLFVPEEERSSADTIKNTLSIPDNFIETALTGHGFQMENGSHASAQKLWDSIAEAIWATGEPAILFRDSVRSISPIDETLVSDATGGFLFLPGSAAPAATINLLACVNGSGIIDIGALQHTTNIMTLTLEAASGLGENPPHSLHPLMLGMTNMAGLLMGHGIAYDSDAGRATAALVAGLVSSSATQTSAEIAAACGAFAAYTEYEKAYLQNIKDKMAALAGSSFLQKGMTRRPAQIRVALCPDTALADAVKQGWENAYRLGKEYGFRHAHLTAMDTSPAMQSLLGAQTQDIMPESTLVRFEGYFSDTLETAQLYGKKLNPMVPRALKALGYTAAESDDIHFYAVGHGTLLDAPYIHHASLRAKGFHQGALDAVEQALATALHIRYAFNKWTLGEEFCHHILGFSTEQLESGTFDMLSALGFSEDHIEAANVYCCGTMTLEGAPHLQPAHLPVFDCIAPSGNFGVRRVSPTAQIKMQAAIEPFLSGAVAHTVMLGHHTSIDDVQQLILSAWELGVKTLRLYRDSCSLLHPLAPPIDKNELLQEEETAPCPKQSVTA